jgi:periplasmic protein TonB
MTLPNTDSGIGRTLPHFSNPITMHLSVRNRICQRQVLSALLLFNLLAPIAVMGANPPGYPAFSKKEYSGASLGPREPEINIDFPGAAAMHGAARGTAVVSVFVNADGMATDFLAVSYTDRAFGAALLEKAKTLDYQAAKLKGTAVAGRCDLNYRFETNRAIMHAQDASNFKGDRMNEPAAAYKAVSEAKLDGDLEFTNAVLPKLPEGFNVPGEKPVKVFVTFFIDEEGRVRIPNVDSSISPLLIPGAINAVQQWSFKPPLQKGKPVLVFTGRLVRFAPR